MLEMKPDSGIETGPGPNPGPGISFEMPAHEMCLERRAVLSRLDGQSEYMTFVIDFMPDVIWIDGRKFKYSGVSDGRGFYREIEVPPLSVQLAESMNAISVCSHGTPYRYPCEDCDREDWECALFNGIPAETATPICSGCGKDLVWEPSIPDTHTEPGHPAVWYCPDCGIDLPARACDLGSMQETGENATPNPRMQCSRCTKMLDLISQMIENPPGLSGIRCHLGHVGNHYVDAGWVEALTRVKWHLVTDGHGTREGI